MRRRLGAAAAINPAAGGVGDPAERAAEPVVVDEPLLVAKRRRRCRSGRIVIVSIGWIQPRDRSGVPRGEIADGQYHLRSVVETTGLVWLFKAYRVEMESRAR